MLNHLIVKRGESLHAIQIRPISRKTSIQRPFINRFISIASHQKSPRNYDAVEVLQEIFLPWTTYLPPLTSSIIIRGILSGREICLPIYCRTYSQNSSEMPCIDCESVWVKCFVEPDTIVSVQAFMLGPY